MVRGISAVVAPDAMLAGTFYLKPDYSGGTWLALCVEAPGDGEGERRRWELVLDTVERHGIFLHTPRDYEPVATLAHVHVRVDPLSKIGSAYSSTRTAGMLAIAEDQAFLLAGYDRGIGRAVVNLSTGEVTTGNLPENWLSFSKWSLVVDDGDTEVMLASFDTEKNVSGT